TPRGNKSSKPLAASFESLISERLAEISAMEEPPYLAYAPLARLWQDERADEAELVVGKTREQRQMELLRQTAFDMHMTTACSLLALMLINAVLACLCTGISMYKVKFGNNPIQLMLNKLGYSLIMTGLACGSVLVLTFILVSNRSNRPSDNDN
ncbi:hypothetical protein BOX15_Mlig030764g3, partial [Macrostomum lignano]